MKTDIEIAQETKLIPINELAHSAGLADSEFEPYGRDKAKVTLDPSRQEKGRLILVTATSGMPAGSGKTTTSIALAQGLKRLGKNAALALREPSLGPVFGMKGGAAGGGYSQVLPMEAINLHFTGDLHAITAANNLLAALLDNARHQGQVQLREIYWRRVLDVNDRMLRNIITGLGGPANGIPTEAGFDITAASELMAVLCLANDLEDLRSRIDRIVLGLRPDGTAYTCGELGATGSLLALLFEAFKPNLVQSIEGNLAFVHGGPFANIAHGCNSVAATRAAMKLADYAITEAGFGSDLGAEKFFNIKCRAAGLSPDAVVIVATVRALKHHGGCPKTELGKENLEALARGLPNLLRHVENITKVYGLPAVVAINKFESDTDAEVRMIREACGRYGVRVALSEVWGKGGAGGVELGEEVLRILEEGAKHFRFAYASELSLKEKIESVARKIYGADGVDYAPAADKELQRLTELGYGTLPVCMAKTQYSLSDDAAKLGAPEGFRITVQKAKVSAGAGFVVVLTGDIMTMPGLPKVPAAENIDVDENGKITGLF